MPKLTRLKLDLPACILEDAKEYKESIFKISIQLGTIDFPEKDLHLSRMDHLFDLLSKLESAGHIA